MVEETKTNAGHQGFSGKFAILRQHIYQNTKAKDSLENISIWMVMNPASQVFD